MSNAGQPHDDGRSIRRRGISASARLARGRLIEEEQAPSPQEHDVASEQPFARRDHVFDPMPTWDGPELNILAPGTMRAIPDGDDWQHMYDSVVGDEGPVRSPHDAEGRQGRNTCHAPPSGQPGMSVPVEVAIERYAGGGARHTVRNRAGRFTQSSGGSCNVGEPDIGRAPRNRRKRQADDTWLVRGPMGGGPQNELVIPSYGGHVAVDVWNGTERGVLRCHARSTLCKQLVTTLPDLSDVAQARIRATGLAHLPAIMFQFLDMALISAFVERWQPDTNTFHMPFGEMTILMHDVEMILAIPTVGSPVANAIYPQGTIQIFLYDPMTSSNPT